MAARMTIERILRDDDDGSGQTIRQWSIDAEHGHITLRLQHGSGFILLRAEDVDRFVADLRRAEAAAATLDD